MKITLLFIIILSIFGCKNREKNITELNQEISENSYKQKKSVYKLIIKKEEIPDNFSKGFEYKKNYTKREVQELKLDTTMIKDNEYYHLSNQDFLNKSLEKINFKIYYRFLYGYLSEKILRIERKDTIFDIFLSASGGDGQETFELSTKFENDSIFEEKTVFRSTIIDDPYLVADKIEIVTTRYQYSQKFDFKKLSVDTTKIPNSAFIDFPSDRISSNFQLTKKDSLNLIKFWRKKAFNIVDTINGNFTNTIIEDLLYKAFSGKGDLLIGGIHQSPDKYFKILTLNGESCGAYCNPFWESLIILSDDTKISSDSFTLIENIYLMTDGKYLVIQQEYSRPASVFTYSTYSAILIGFEDNEIAYYPFKYNYSKYNDISNDSIYNPSGKLSLNQEHFIDKEQWLKYDINSKELRYQYGTDLNYCCNIDSAYIYTGKFKYVDGEFRHTKETKEYIKIE